MHTKPTFSLFTITALALLLTTLGIVGVAYTAQAQAQAQTQTQEPAAAAEAFVKQKYDAILRAFRKAPGTARAEALDRQLNGFFDYQTLSRRALSAHWDGLEEAQRTEFVSILQQLVEKQYRSSLQSTMNYNIAYEGTAQHGSNVVVQTTARSRRNRRSPPVSIAYSLHKRGNAWRVYDIETDGVSLVRNYRSQFNRIIRRDGWSGLMDRMKKRLADS